MDFCLSKILEYYKTNNKVSPDKIEELYKEVQALHDKGMSQREVVSAVEHIAEKSVVNTMYDLTRANLNLEKLSNLKNESLAYNGKNLTKYVQSLLMNTGETGYAVGRNVENLRSHYERALVNTLDMAIMSRDAGHGLYQQMRQFTFDENLTVLQKMMKETQGEILPEYQMFADIYEHHNNVIFGEKSKIGVPDFKRNNYSFKRAYSGEAIKDAGLKQFSLDLISNTKKDILAQSTEKPKLKALLDFLRDPNTTDKDILNILKSDNPKYTQLKESMSVGFLEKTYDAFNNWSPESGMFSADIMDDYIGGKGKVKMFSMIEWEFNDARSLLTFMDKYGKYGHDIYSYIKADSKQTAKQLAVLDKFGPEAVANKDALFGALETRAASNASVGFKFNRQDAEMMFNYALGRVSKLPSTLAEAQGAGEVVGVVMNQVSKVATSSVLSASAITQAFMDPAMIVVGQLERSNEGLFRSFATLTNHYFGAMADTVKQAVTKNPTVYLEIADLAERSLGDIHFTETLTQGSPLGHILNAFTYPAELFNRHSANLSFRILSHLIKNNMVDKPDVFLGRYGMSTKDLNFLLDKMEMLPNPTRLYTLPDFMFEGNPSNMRPFKYKTEMSKAISMFLDENRKQLAPQVGDSQKYYMFQLQNMATKATGKVEAATAPINVVLQAILHLKMLGFKAFNDMSQVIDMTSNSVESGVRRNAPINSVYIASKYAAAIGIAGTSMWYFKELLKEGFDNDKVYKRFMKGDKETKNEPAWKYALVSSVARYSPLSAILEPMVGKGNIGENIVMTPASKAILYTASGVIKPPINFIMGREPIDYQTAKDFTEGLKMMVPGQSAINITPYAKGYVDTQKKITKYIERLDGK